MFIHETTRAVVIGGGPAGAQCSLWLTKLGVPCILLEKGDIGGLQARSPYTNSWLTVVQATTLAAQVAINMETNLQEQGVRVAKAEVIKIEKKDDNFFVHTNMYIFQCDVVVIATGTLENDGGLKNKERCVIGLVGAFDTDFSNKDVAILGGGDAATECFLAIRESASRLKLFARTVRARPEQWNRINPIDKYVGNYAFDGDMIHTGEFGESFSLYVICYGWQPVIPTTDFEFERNDRGYISVDEHMQTTVPGLYSIGDVNARPYPCVSTAMSDGVYAAKHIESVLR